MYLLTPPHPPEQYLAALLAHRPAFLHMVPPLVSFLASHPAVTADHLASVTTVFAGAAPVGTVLLGLLNKKAPHIRFNDTINARFDMSYLAGSGRCTA